jgi:hypothetical protein
MREPNDRFEENLREIMKSEDPAHPYRSSARREPREDEEHPAKPRPEGRGVPRWVEIVVRTAAAVLAVVLLLLFALRIAFG